ncbi:MAG: tripartite tricarboxylate transporter substrate binding protein [Betaproteobacteria bacterium]|nr:MAG: tripartite tricarboxylate transporter substrate binding protein [Betaproteobacteria bacterium]
MPIRRLSKLVALAAALCCGTAAAQTFPARALKILVPSVAGSSPDIRARQIAAKLAEAFGQPVIVENRTGANGLIAAREAAKAPPDGHTLFLALINNALIDVISPDPCCRLGSELIPVSRFSMTPYLVLVNADVPAQTLQELVALARAKPDTVTLASHGPGSLPNLLGAWLKAEWGAHLLEVPYKGVNSEIPDLQSGQVMSAFIVPQVVLGPLKAGKDCRASRRSSGTASSSRPARRRVSWSGCIGSSCARTTRPRCASSCAQAAPMRPRTRRRSSPPSSVRRRRSGAA